VTVRLRLDTEEVVGAVDPRLFGSFVEHMGRCVYTGIFEPGHPSADAHGFRQDVLALVRELGVTTIRYPGGNFVSSYRWEDGIGPVEERPVRLDLAWRSRETNRLGTDEFLDWTRAAGVEPMLAVNFGTRGIQEACDLLEYCNHPGGTAWSDRRRANGHEEPHGVRLWCLGNEMDGPWQVGQRDAASYAWLAAETAKAMKLVDPAVELVACGSSHSGMPTFGTWEETVLERCFDHVEYLSLHAYYRQERGDLQGFLASCKDMDATIERVVGIADAIAATRGSDRRIDLSFDEWNVWDYERTTIPDDWPEAPRLIEDTYTVADALVVGTLLITLLRHADRVKIACQAQLVNVIGMIRTEPGGPAWRQTIFHPFAQVARLAAGGTVLRVAVDDPGLEAVAVAGDGTLTLFAVNRSETALDLDAELAGLGAFAVREHLVLADTDLDAANTEAEPERIVPRQGGGATVEGAVLRAQLPPLSWNVVRLERT
jgi:alpha-N-arabinofuranosidase